MPPCKARTPSPVAREEPDGYTLGVTNLTTMSVLPVIAPKTPYHPIKDFTHIAYIAGAPVMLAVHPSTKVKTVAEFIEYGKTVGKPLTVEPLRTASRADEHGIVQPLRV